MKIIVQKFGGTSVAKPENRVQVAQRIIESIEAGYTPVVVVSAMGRKGEPYATDTLINLATSINADINPRELDLLMSCGEIISGVVMANTLKGLGHDAVMMTGGQAGIITNDCYGNGRIIELDPAKIIAHLEEGKVVVVAGFQGQTEDGEVITLGRGGSDTTAAALGVALDAEVVEIFTDVDGVMTADPRIVPDAQTLDVITYGEVCEMAYQGAKVIHPRAVEIAMQKNIPLKVRCTFSDAPGTLITNALDRIEYITLDNEAIITGITHIANLAQLKITVKEPQVETEKLRALQLLAEAQINIDLINVSPQSLAFVIKEDLLDQAVEALASLKNIEIKIERECAKISVVGATIDEIPGVMASIITTLDHINVPILQTSDSTITISCLIKQADMQKAVCELHEYFISLKK